MLGAACASSSAPASSSASPDARDDRVDAALDADTANGPAACVAAGGQCLIGGTRCVHVGAADCNPDLNPGGAFCCLDEPADADVGVPSDAGDAGG